MCYSEFIWRTKFILVGVNQVITIIFIHAFTRCDIISAFCNEGRNQFYKTFNSNIK